jgi:hypothetical protein
MGYRSDVKIVFYLTKGTVDVPPTEDNPLVPFAALKLWFEENYPVREAKDEWCAEIDYGEGLDHILVSYTDVKWYSGYDHVQAIESVFEKFTETFRSHGRDHRAQYEIVRIGENDDDIERDCSDYADHRLYVERSIIFE